MSEILEKLNFNNDQELIRFTKSTLTRLDELQSWGTSVTLPQAIHATNISDSIQCFTDYSPKASIQKHSLLNKIIGGSVVVHRINLERLGITETSKYKYLQVDSINYMHIKQLNVSDDISSSMKGYWHSEIYDYVGKTPKVCSELILSSLHTLVFILNPTSLTYNHR